MQDPGDEATRRAWTTTRVLGKKLHRGRGVLPRFGVVAGDLLWRCVGQLHLRLVATLHNSISCKSAKTP
jgi:hypothetical protein